MFRVEYPLHGGRAHNSKRPKSLPVTSRVAIAVRGDSLIQAKMIPILAYGIQHTDKGFIKSIRLVMDIDRVIQAFKSLDYPGRIPRNY